MHDHPFTSLPSVMPPVPRCPAASADIMTFHGL